MKKESIYLDTSVPSALYDERVKERQEATIKFWESVLPNFHASISEITLEKLKETVNENLRGKLISLTTDFKILKINKRIQELAGIYIENEIFSARYFADALHVAIASFYEIAYLISWNFEHLVKVKTRRMVNSVNILEGLKEIEIISPLEL